MRRWGLPAVYVATEEEADDILRAIDATCTMSRGCVDGLTVHGHYQLTDVKFLGIWHQRWRILEQFSGNSTP